MRPICRASGLAPYGSILFVLAALLAACRGAPENPKPDRVLVFAATSLHDVLTSLGDSFQKAHPGTEVTFNFAGSQELRTQIEQGAAADVLAAADRKTMDTLHTAGKVGDSAVFARNEPVIVLARPSATQVAPSGLADLGAATYTGRIVVGGPDVPIGRYTQQILDKATATLGADFRTHFEARIVSRELNVKQVLAKVMLGEADAGIVYRTDTLGPAQTGEAAKIDVRTINPEWNVIAEYPVAVVTGAPNAARTAEFVAYLRGDEGQKALAAAGFLGP